MSDRSHPLEVLLKAVEAGDLKAARAAAAALSNSPGSNPLQLAAEVLHELRQPLLGIKGYMQMLGEEDGPHRSTVPLVLSQVERMEHIISDFTRLSSSKQAPKERVSLTAHVIEAQALFTRNPDSAKTSLEVDATPGIEVLGNGRLLEQLTLNLMNNARDAMSGRGRIQVVVTRDAGAPVLYVADWGPGIAPEIRERLFEPYVTSKQRGSGLGLSVCRRIAEEHGATIDLAPPSVIPESPPPATVFRVRFPISIEAQPAAPARKRLLVVDDESIIRSIFRDLMARECDVVEADTAEEALSLLRAPGAKYDLIVTDKNLPGLSGLELAQEARRLDANSRVIMMTGYPSLVTAQQALELGVVDYLLKPFDDIRQVREKIRQVLTTRTAARTGPVSKRIDIYEDNEQSAKAISDALTQLGMEPRVLTSKVPGGDEAPAAVVVSWDFGPAPGRAAVDLGKQMAKGAPFVMLVEHLNMDTTLEALRAGCAACLPKLLSDPKALSRELSRALKLSP